MPDTRPALVLHYCRLCGEPCTGDRSRWISAHGDLWDHTLKTHGRQETLDLHILCSQHCTSKAQSEEIKAGRRMYGEGVPAPVEQIRAPYEAVFPEDSDA